MIAQPASSTRVSCALFAVALLACLWTPSRAQDGASDERLRLIQEQSGERASGRARNDDLKLPDSGEYFRETGGWLNVTYLDLTDLDHVHTAPDLLESLFIADLRVWVGGDITEHCGGYLRVRGINIAYAAAPGAAAPDTSTQEGFDVDLAYLDYDVGRDTNARLGRQFVSAGRGLVLALDLDGIALDHRYRQLRYRGFIGRTVARDLNIDNSIVGFNQSTQERYFATAQGEHTNRRGRTVYGFAVIQRDRSSSDDPVQDARPFQYDSNYFGLGAKGQFSNVLHYYLEMVHEGGEMMADLATSPRVEIDAGALTSGLLYYPVHRWRPMGSLEYAHGSGDSTRGSVTNTFGGKFAATTDNNFLYFGVYDGGLALSPRLSDLNVARLGYQIRPLPKKGRELPELLFGTKLSRYWKDLPGGIISDPAALLASRDIGVGFDMFSAYRPFSDVSLLVHYGRFEPGLAYPTGLNDRSSRLLFTTSVSF